MVLPILLLLLVISYDVVVFTAVPVVVADLNNCVVSVVELTFCFEDKR